MLKKYLSKFAMDIFPSVVATIIGAYIVNHYIVTKPASDAPSAAAVSPAQAGKADTTAATSAATKPSESKLSEANSAGTTGGGTNFPEPGVKAKGISEKTITEKSAAEKALIDKPAEKVVDKPAETASMPVDTRRRPLQTRERTLAKAASGGPATAAPVQAAVPVVAVPNAAPPIEAAPVQEERRDANDLARAAIERLRGAGDTSPRAQEGSRGPFEAPRIPDQSHLVLAPPAPPLPPPITVSTPAAETPGIAADPSLVSPPYTGTLRGEDFAHPTPPADIPLTGPVSRPLDLHAEVMEQGSRERTTVTEDVLSAAKSLFEAVLPK